MKRFFTQTWHRNILEDMLHMHASLLHGHIIDIGSERRRYDQYFDADIDAVDIHPTPNLNIRFGDIEKGIDAADASYDGAVCTEVLEYLTKPDAAIAEIARLLKPGAPILLSVPFVYPDHGDAVRFTDQRLSEMLQPYFSNLTVHHMGNKWTVMWDIYRLGFFRSLGRFLGPLKYLWVVFGLPYLALVMLFSLHRRDDEWYSGLFVIAKK